MTAHNQVVAITGAGSGIGAAMAAAFAARGARLALLDVDANAVETIAGDLGGLAVVGDVAEERATLELIERAKAELGPIDVFCANAGIATQGGVEVTDADWSHIWEVNVMAHVWAARALVPDMIARGRGHLVHTASAAGLLSQVGSAPYAVTKHAVVALAEWLAITYGDRGLRVSVLAPQGVRTAMTESITQDGVVGGVAALDGMLEPAEVAEHVIRGVEENRFLILPHPQVASYFAAKATDYERWLGGMRRLNRRFGEE